MGPALGVLGKLGFPSVDTLTAKPVYENFFQNITKYEDFHKTFVKLCSNFSSAMPGTHYVLKATDDEIQKLYKQWSEARGKGEKQNKISEEEQKKIDDDAQKKILLDFFLKDHVEVYKASSMVMMTTGLVAPGAAVLVKRSSQSVPQLKMLRLDLVPNAVFVPAVTLLSVIGVRMVNVSQALQKR